LSNSGGIEGVFLSLILVMWGVGISTLNNLAKIKRKWYSINIFLGLSQLGVCNVH
jgi:hypothetical protein